MECETAKVAIPFVSLYTEQKGALTEAIFGELRKTIESSNYILGEKVAAFEHRFAELCGTRFAIGVNSGLDALILSLRALGIGPGDEVITAPNSFLASASAIALVGATPVFADVGRDYNLDPLKLESALTKRTRALLPVHLTGNPCDMDAIGEFARKHSLLVIEDAAQAIGATFQGKPVGSFGDTGCFSLHPLKNLHVWGDGGVITTNSEEVAKNLSLQRNHGLVNRDESLFFSYNSRLDTIQAIVGLAYLELLKGTTAQRRRHAQIYDERLAFLSGKLNLPIVDGERAAPVYHVYQITTSRRDALKQFLAERGVETKIHYPVPIHFQKAASGLGYQVGDFPLTEQLAKEILSLPVRENLTDEQVHTICNHVIEYFTSA